MAGLNLYLLESVPHQTNMGSTIMISMVQPSTPLGPDQVSVILFYFNGSPSAD
jgi:hypothetical protein